MAHHSEDAIRPALVRFDAELAIRWDPQYGGPGTAANALTILGLGEDDSSEYAVVYLTPVDIPELDGFVTILRQRTHVGKQKSDLTIKYRGAQPLPAIPTLDNWNTGFEGEVEKKDEMDVTFLVSEVRKRYSRSGTVKFHGGAPLLRDVWKPMGNPSESRMRRLKSGLLVVEEWLLPDGTRTVEVSRKGAGDEQDIADFRSTVVDALLPHNVQPLSGSKTEAIAHGVR